MYHSAALFTFRPGTSPEQIEELAAALKIFASRLDAIVEFSCGTDLRIRQGTDDFAVLASFHTEDAMRTYLTHPDHAVIVADIATPIMATKHNAQFRT